MDLKDLVKTGLEKKPIKIILYGNPGIGKSTFGSQAPSPIFLPTEDGISRIDIPHFPLSQKLSEVWEYLKIIIDQDHQYKTLVIDTLDWLEKLIWQEVCKIAGVESIESLGYGKGYLFAMQHWDKFFRGLDKVRDKGIAIILLAHCEIKPFSPPDGDPYDRWQIKIHKTAAAKAEEWSDAVLFANYKVYVRTEKGKQSGKATGGDRIIYTKPNPAYRAKNRYNLPDEIPFNFSELLKGIQGDQKQ